MNKQLVKGLVLLLAIAGASVYVWQAGQRAKPHAAQQTENSATELPKLGEATKIVVTDEEVKKSRELMMSSSKSGIVISEEETRKILEKSKILQSQQKVDFIAPSSKSAAIFSPQETKELTEKIAPPQPAPSQTNDQK